jgi:hypothetical protein
MLKDLLQTLQSHQAIVRKFSLISLEINLKENSFILYEPLLILKDQETLKKY